MKFLNFVAQSENKYYIFQKKVIQDFPNVENKLHTILLA